jgi:hypothetical protein
MKETTTKLLPQRNTKPTVLESNSCRIYFYRCLHALISDIYKHLIFFILDRKNLHPTIFLKKFPENKVKVKNDDV